MKAETRDYRPPQFNLESYRYAHVREKERQERRELIKASLFLLGLFGTVWALWRVF